MHITTANANVLKYGPKSRISIYMLLIFVSETKCHYHVGICP